VLFSWCQEIQIESSGGEGGPHGFLGLVPAINQKNLEGGTEEGGGGFQVEELGYLQAGWVSGTGKHTARARRSKKDEGVLTAHPYPWSPPNTRTSQPLHQVGHTWNQRSNSEGNNDRKRVHSQAKTISPKRWTFGKKMGTPPSIIQYKVILGGN